MQIPIPVVTILRWAELLPLRYSSRLGPLAAVAAGVYTNSVASEAGDNHSQSSNAGSTTNIRLASEAMYRVTKQLVHLVYKLFRQT